MRNHVYHPDFGGSFSLKSVLPAMVRDLLRYCHQDTWGLVRLLRQLRELATR